MALVPYVVKQGDHLSSLASRFGFVADEVWNDPKNEVLKEKRKNPNILMTGDVLYIPEPKKKWLALSAGTTNTFTATVPMVDVHLRFMDKGQPAANMKYEITGADIPPGATDGDGAVKLSVPATTAKFFLRLVEQDKLHEVRVGHLDPANEPSGAWARLGCMGHFGTGGGDVTGTNEELAVALRIFQRQQKLESTGELDEATVKKLVEVFGS